MSSSSGETQCEPPIERSTRQHPDFQHKNLLSDAKGEGAHSEQESTRVSTDRSWIQAIRSETVGWRAWVTGLASLTLAVLILNSVLTGLAFSRRHQYSYDHGLATFYTGPCPRTTNINRVIKLAINILASCLLGASNYCMQVLISPLREEVDRAHDKKQWLFIGMPNVKNLFFIDYKRRIIWAILFVTSVPLHLFWNSAVVHTIISNNYFVAGVSRDFTQGALTPITSYNTQPWFIGQDQDLQDWLLRARNGDAATLDTQQCLDVYTNNFVTEYSNLVMVMDTTNATNSLLFAGTYVSEVLSHAGLGELWPCGLPAPHTRPCGFAKLRHDNATHWTPLNTLAGSAFEGNNTYLVSLSETPVAYCIADTPNPQCRLSAHPQILVIVLVCNAVKLIGIVSTWFFASMKDDRCITSGELIKSYIRRPDPRFYNRCLAGIDLIKKYPEKFWGTEPWPMTWEKRKMRSWRGVPAVIWLFYIIPAFCGTIALLGIFLGYRLQNTLYVGFGIPSLSSTLPWYGKIRVIQATIVANLPQLLVGYIYFGCNAVLTGIWSQGEILHYSKAVLNALGRDDDGESSSKRKKRRAERRREEGGPQALRVTQPQGGQRETYYLTLPWSSSIPLLIGSIALHWFVSEGLFLLRVAVVNTDGVEDNANVITTVGYSSGAILAIILTLFIQLLTVMGIGFFKRYEMTMPLVGACSAAIGAISQPAVDKCGNARSEHDMDLGKLYWGVVGVSKISPGSAGVRSRHRSGNGKDTNVGFQTRSELETDCTILSEFQHATFSARPVQPLFRDTVYA